MLHNLYYFIDERGRNPVREFVDRLSIKEQSKILSYFDILKEYGHNLRRPIADYLGNDIYYLRTGKNRLFYFFFLKDNAVLVHAIRKKTAAIPRKDIDLCLKRKAQVEALKQIELIESGGGQNDKS